MDIGRQSKRPDSGRNRLGINGTGDGRKQIQPKEMGLQIHDWLLCPWKNMQQWKMRSSTTCPQCSVLDEDKMHVITCLHSSAQKHWDKALIKLENWMTTAKMEPILQSKIVVRLQQWRTGGDTTEQQEKGTYKTHSQDKLGWHLALEGVLTTQWCMQQEQYWQRIKS